MNKETLMKLVENQLVTIQNDSVSLQIKKYIVEPCMEMRNWEYGKSGQQYPCWIFLKHEESNTGIAYCEHGFGPRNPWGLIVVDTDFNSIGMDSSWYSSLEKCFEDSPAYKEN